MKVSVIICCYTHERFQDTLDAVASVESQTRLPDELILAVDNNRQLFEDMQAELGDRVNVVLSEPPQGISGNRNTGIAAANCDVVVFLDDDAVAQHDWLENLIQPFEDQRTVAVGGEIVPSWQKNRPPFWLPDEFDFVFGCTAHKQLIIKQNNEIRNVSGASMAFRKEVIEAAGLFDTGLSRKRGRWMGQTLDSGEEAEVCLRIKAKEPEGLILHEPKAVVLHKIHPRRATLWYVFNYCFQEGQNRAKIETKLAKTISNALGTERLFLRRVVFRSGPARLLGFYRPANLAQLAVISANLMLIAAGYLVGKIKYRTLAP